MQKVRIVFAWALALILVLAGVSVPVTAEEAEKAEETPSGEIHIYSRDASSGTRAAFEEIVGFEEELSDTALETSSNGDMAAKVGQDANGIGYVSLTTDFEANNIVPVKFNGVEASVETVVSGDYKLARPFNYVTRAEGDFDSQEKQDLVEAFIAFLTQSKEAKEVVLANGGVVDVEEGTPWEELKKDYPIVDQDNSDITITTAGSTSVEKTLTAALEMFQPMAGNFQITVSQTGSGDGFKRVLGEEKDSANASDIGFASRDFKEEETVEDGFLSGTYSLDAVVVVFSADGAQYDDLSQAQVKAIFTGAVTDYSEVPDVKAGGITTSSVDGDIHVYTRDASSGTRAAFEEIVGFQEELSEDAFETSSNGDMAAKVGQDPNAIGYVSLTTDFEANHIKPLEFEGIEANVENVNDGDYSLARPFNYVTRADGDFDSDEKQQLVEAFIAFLTESKEAKEVILANGGVVDVEEGKPWDELKKDYPIVDQDNSALTISTAGSTSVEKTLTAVLEMFQPMAGNFQINVSQTGSGDGFKRVLGEEKDSANAADIGFASRHFKDEETVEDGLLSGTYSLDAVVVVVQEDNDIENQFADSLQKIFKGEVTKWSELE